jgi:hypothetical protein
MEALSLLRAQVSAKHKYLSSAQAVEDATYAEMATLDRFEVLTGLAAKAAVLDEVLNDIDAMLSPALRRQALSRGAA